MRVIANNRPTACNTRCSREGRQQMSPTSPCEVIVVGAGLRLLRGAVGRS